MSCDVLFSAYAALFYNVQRVLQSIQNTDQTALPGGSGTSKQPGENSAANHTNVAAGSAISKTVVSSSILPSTKENTSSSGSLSGHPQNEMLVFLEFVELCFEISCLRVTVCLCCFDTADGCQCILHAKYFVVLYKNFFRALALGKTAEWLIQVMTHDDSCMHDHERFL